MLFLGCVVENSYPCISEVPLGVYDGDDGDNDDGNDDDDQT